MGIDRWEVAAGFGTWSGSPPGMAADPVTTVSAPPPTACIPEKSKCKEVAEEVVIVEFITEEKSNVISMCSVDASESCSDCQSISPRFCFGQLG